MGCAGRSARRNFVFSNFNRFEKIVEVAGGVFADFFRGKPAKFAQLPRGFRHERRLISLAAVGHGREEWAIGLNQHPVEGNFVSGVPNLLSFGKGDVASKRKQDSKMKSAPRMRNRAREAVENAGESFGRPLFLNHAQ